MAGSADGDISCAGQQWGGVSTLFAGIASVRQGADEVWKVRIVRRQLHLTKPVFFSPPNPRVGERCLPNRVDSCLK